MFNNYYTLFHLSREFNRSLSGARILQAATRIKQTFEILFEIKDHGTARLVVSCVPSDNFIYMVKTDSSGRNFAGKKLRGANVFPEIVGKVPEKIGVVANERQLYVEFGDQHFLRVNMFGSVANAYYTNPESVIINSFLKPSEKVDKRLSVVANLVGFPTDATDLRARYSNSAGAMAHRISKCVPTTGPMVAREISYRYYIRHGTHAEDDPVDFELLSEVLAAIEDELMNPSPRIYYSEESDENDFTPIAFGLIELKHLESKKSKKYDSVNECIREFRFRFARSKRSSDIKTDILGQLNRKINSLRRTLTKMDSDSDNSREEKYRRFGEYIMSHLADVRQGDTSIFADEIKAEIELNPALTPVRNAQAYFDKAKHTRLSGRQTEERKREISKELREAEILSNRVERQKSGNLLDPLKEPSIVSRWIPSEEERRSPFREFEKSGYKIFVGKDAKNNDKLTFGFAKPNDVFLHARGVSGSHVIIRNSSRELPQKPVLQFAASIAAHYSRARTSSIVPVAYTMRKFVKKAKGNPGAVFLDREEVIFVKPGIHK